MVEEIRIYFEGHTSLRPGFHRFLRDVVAAARRNNVRFQLIAGDATAPRDFQLAEETHPNALNILLIDSEGPASGRPLPLVSRRGDWDESRAQGVGDEQIHLMVQVMETWFLADRDALGQYYGRAFRENRLPANPRIEDISKGDVLNGLKEATRETTKGRYHKTKHAPALLAKINTDKVRGAAPHCERLFQTLEAAITGGEQGSIE